MGFVVDFDFTVGCSHLHKCRRGPANLLLSAAPVEVLGIGTIVGSGGALPISDLACRRAVLVVPFLGRLREGRGMNSHDRGNVCVVRGGGCGGCGGRRSGRLGGHRDLAGEGRLRQHPILVCCGRGRLSLVTRGRRRSGRLRHAEGAAHQGGYALIVGVDGEDDSQMGNGFCAPPFGDQEFSEMLA